MKCDIIILVWNQLNFTKQCIDSVLNKTKFPFNLIIVDNGSEEPTRQYLEKLSQKERIPINLLRNERNLGFVKAANQGIKQSQSEYICLLNNDTVVTTNWLTEMVKVAQGSEVIGIVNANSNTLGCKSKREESPEAIAQRLKSYSGEYSELAWATGFCMLIKRHLIKKIGLFDERYGMGNFEDADFCKKAQQVGYLCVCAKAAYVYHYEKRSFIKIKTFDYDFGRNRQIFFSKWGRQERILYVLTKDNPQNVKKIAQKALQYARQGNIVWIFLKHGYPQLIYKHSNIYIYTLPKAFFNIISYWKVLKRKKKFDKIYVDDEAYIKRLNIFKLFHKAEVIYGQ
jgi:GT2 family glycosyltransferase